MSPADTARSGDMSLTVLVIVSSPDRSRDFYHAVMAPRLSASGRAEETLKWSHAA